MPLVWSTHSMCSHANREMARFETIFQGYVIQIRKHGTAAMALLILLVEQASKSIICASFFPTVNNYSNLCKVPWDPCTKNLDIIAVSAHGLHWLVLSWMNATDWPSLQSLHFARIRSMKGYISFWTRIKLFVKQNLDTRSGFLEE